MRNDGHQFTEDLISLAEAAEYCDYSQDYLSLLARKGRLRAVKQQGAWMTTRRWLQDYINTVRNAPNSKQHSVEPRDASPSTTRPREWLSPSWRIGTLTFVAIIGLAFLFGSVFIGARHEAGLKTMQSKVATVVGDMVPHLDSVSHGFDFGNRNEAISLADSRNHAAAFVGDWSHSAGGMLGSLTQRLRDVVRNAGRFIFNEYIVSPLRERGFLVRDDFKDPSTSLEESDGRVIIVRNTGTREIVTEEVTRNVTVVEGPSLGPIRTNVAQLSSSVAVMNAALREQGGSIAALRALVEDSTITRTIREEVVVEQIREFVVEREQRVIEQVIAPVAKITTLGDQDDNPFTFKDPEGFDWQTGKITFSTDGDILQSGTGDVTFNGVLAVQNGLTVSGKDLNVSTNATVDGDLTVGVVLRLDPAFHRERLLSMETLPSREILKWMAQRPLAGGSPFRRWHPIVSPGILL